MIFEASEDASPASLRQFVAKVCDIPLDRFHVAKYFRAKYEWMVIRHTPQKQVNHCYCMPALLFSFNVYLVKPFRQNSSSIVVSFTKLYQGRNILCSAYLVPSQAPQARGR